MRSCLYRTDDRRVDGRVALSVEEPLEIRVNGVPQAAVMRTPGHEIELAAGFCLTEGIVDAPGEILTIGFCEEPGAWTRNVVNVVVAAAERDAPAPSGGGRAEAPRRNLPSRSSCGICGVEMLEDLRRRLAPLPSGPVFGAGQLVALQREMERRQELHDLTKGSHAALLARSPDEVLVVREDVGRHNALDKALGHALLRGLGLDGCVAMLSGRISFEMVQKAVRARIPVLVAVSAATSLAVTLADELNCTLAGWIRGSQMVVYTHPSRIRE